MTSSADHALECTLRGRGHGDQQTLQLRPSRPPLTTPRRVPAAESQRPRPWLVADLETSLLGRDVELLRLQQMVLAQAGITPPLPKAVAQLRNAPFLFLTPHGVGKTHLLTRLIRSLTHEHPSLRVVSHYASAGCGFADSARTALTQLYLKLLEITAAEEARACVGETVGKPSCRVPAKTS